MNKDIIIAKIRRQLAEIREMVEELKDDKAAKKIVDVLRKRCRETRKLIEALEDKSLIPRDQEDFAPERELDRISQKVKKVKSGVKKIEKLEKKKKRIEKEME